MNVVVVDDANRKSVGYFCFWGVKLSGSKFLQLLNSCYNIVDSLSEVSLSKCSYIIMETVHYNNEQYCVAVQGIFRKNSTLQELYIYSYREYIIYDWYWSMAYLCVLNNKDGKYILPGFSGTIFKAGKSNIYSKAYQIFRNVYEQL